MRPAKRSIGSAGSLGPGREVGNRAASGVEANRRADRIATPSGEHLLLAIGEIRVFGLVVVADQRMSQLMDSDAQLCVG
jgi:hypothetical protein